MANVTKIYELKTVGYDQVITQLKSIEASFEAIRKAKNELNKTKFDGSDAEKVNQLNTAIKEEKIRTAELRLERQKLVNEAKALQNAKQIEIAQSKQQAAGNAVETASLKNLVAQRKELFSILERRNTGGGGTGTIEFRGQNIQIAEAIKLYQRLGVAVGEAKARLTGLTQSHLSLGEVGQRVNTALANGFASMKGQLSQMIFMYTGWFAAFREAGKIIAQNIEMSDTFANLQIRLKGSREDVDKLFESLKKIDTRTSLKDLTDIAAVVSKKGVAADQVAALTAEFDKLNVVLGSEIGNPASATASIIKLITIFNDDKHVTADRVQEIGVALTKLTTSGVATGDFLINFAERVGAVRGITGLTLPSILGMGAALQQLGQRTEVAGTAAVQLTTRLFSDIPKFAKAAQMSVEDFRKTLTDDPFKALVAVAEGLKNIPTDQLKNQFEDVVTAFGEVGIVGVRIKAVLGDIATNGDFVAKRMNDAKVTTEDYTNQAEALNIKQQTFAATLDRVRKGLESIGTNKAVQVTLSAIAAVILLIVNNLGLIITALSLYATAWVIANAEMIRARVVTMALNAAFVFQYAILQVTTTFSRAYTAAMLYLTGATNAATASTRLLTIAMRLLPIGILITAIAILVAGCTRLSTAMKGITEEARRNAIAQQALIDIQEKSIDIIGSQISTLDSWIAVLNNATASADTNGLAMRELIAIDERFSKAIKGNIVDLNTLKEVYKQVTAEIKIKAEAEASASLSAEKQKELIATTTLRQRLEIKAARAKASEGFFFTGNDAKILEDLPGVSKQTNLDLTTSVFTESKAQTEKVIKELIKKEEQLGDDYQIYINLQAANQKKVLELGDKKKKEVAVINEGLVSTQIKEALKTAQSKDELEVLIKAIRDESGKLKEGDAKLEELNKAEDIFQARLDKLNRKKGPKTQEYRGARVGGEQKDELAEIQARMNLELALAEEEYAEKTKLKRATFLEEATYTNQIADIHQRYVTEKVRYLQNLKTLNAAEKLALSTHRKELVDIELKRAEDIQKIKDKEFQRQKRDLEIRLANEINDIQTGVKTKTSDVTLPSSRRAQIKLDGDRQILALQEKFNKDIDQLEKGLNQRSNENLRQGAQTREEILKDIADVLNGQIKDASDAGDNMINELKANANKQITTLLESDKSPARIAKEIQAIEDRLRKDMLAAEVARLKIELELYQQGYRDKLKTQKEYLDAVQKLSEAEVKLADSNANKVISIWDNLNKALKNLSDSFLENVLGIRQYTNDDAGRQKQREDAVLEAEEHINDAITQTYQNYFENEARKIDMEKEARQARVDREAEQLKAQAQSADEEASIEKQAADKKKKIEKEAAEEKKKLALKQLSIDFALALLKTFAQFGFPLGLIPAAALTALYFVQRGNINAQQFEKGGWVDRGGPIRGRSHKHGGVKFNYEAEDGELGIVNKRSANATGVYAVKGTVRQIASKINEIGGGVAFDQGASFSRHFADGGLLGSRFTAPSYTPSSSFGGNDSNELRADTIALVRATNERIDRIEVVQETATVTNAQRKQVQQNSVGVL